MVKNQVIAFVALIIIIAIVVFSFFIVQDDNEDSYNLDVFEVSDENDDARTFTAELSTLGYETENGVWQSLQLSPSYSFGVRFINVTIPTNVTLVDAYVELYSTGSPGLDHPNCNIYCDNADDSVNFTLAGALNISGRNYTENFATWNTTVTYGEWVKSPSITSLVQEVISRENWTSGNSITVLFVTNKYSGYAATFQNYERGYPAKLYIKWK